MLVQWLLVSKLLLALVCAETHTWNFTASWLDGYNPDGTYERRVIGFNGKWPLPNLYVNKGDRVQLYLTNGFGDGRNTSLHFHGLFQEGTNNMDGPQMVTQCPIPDGETMLYNFTVPNNTGAYWYHSHTDGQYGDGMRAAFIIKDDDFPYEYDEETVVTLAEWYHTEADVLRNSFLNRFNPTGAEPIPQNLLMNDTRNLTWAVEPDKTYLLRVINVGAFVSQYFWIEDHEMTIVEVDGVVVEKNVTDMIYVTVAQRYTVLVKTKNDTSRNYAIMQKVDDTMLDTLPSDLVINATNYLVYNSSADMPDEDVVDALDFTDDFYLTPYDKVTVYDSYDYQITVDVVMDNLGNGVNYAFFNNITYTTPLVPSTITAMTSGDDATNPLVYGTNTHAFVLQKDEIVEIVVNNQDTGTHPFHLHGHIFQVIERGPDYGDEPLPIGYNESTPYDPPENPMMRDTMYVRPQSYFVIRFKANNPGVWFFHCHIEWHLLQGLAIVLVEDPLSMQEQQTLGDNFLSMCEKNSIPTKGNAAGNSDNFLDLTGQNVQVHPLPSGFTARGIVALVFSCIAGFVGCVAIGVYGMADVADIEQRVATALDIDLQEYEDENSTGTDAKSHSAPSL